MDATRKILIILASRFWLQHLPSEEPPQFSLQIDGLFNQIRGTGVYNAMSLRGVDPIMKRTGKVLLLTAAFAFAVIPLLSQTPRAPKPSFEVISIKPSAPGLGIRGGGPRGDKYTVTGANLRMLLSQGYSKGQQTGPLSQLQIIGGPSWMDSDRYDIQATADCSGGAPLAREQVQLMIQSMLEDRFQLKSHMETRELPIYNLVVAKDGPKLKASADQSPSPFAAAGPPQPCGPAPNIPAPPLPPPPAPGQRGGPGDPNFVMPRGAMLMMMSPTGLTMQASGVPLSNMIGMLQQQVGRPIVDKTDLKGLYDFKLTFSPEGLSLPGAPGGLQAGPGPGGAPGPAGPGAAPTPASDPVPSLFTAIQELGLRLESTKGPVEVLVVDSVQKPTEN
jgi:uncharacterized protein (TIGR03435 family)